MDTGQNHNARNYFICGGKVLNGKKGKIVRGFEKQVGIAFKGGSVPPFESWLFRHADLLRATSGNRTTAESRERENSAINTAGEGLPVFRPQRG